MATPDAAPAFDELTLPPELPVLPVRSTVILPLSVLPLAVTAPMAVASINRALAADRMVAVLFQEQEGDEPDVSALPRVGTAGIIRQMARGPGGLQVLIEGLARIRATDIKVESGQITAAVARHPERVARSIEVDAHVRRIRELVDRAFSLASGLPPELRVVITSIDDPLRLVYLLASLIDMKPKDRQLLLEQDDLLVKLAAVSSALSREVELLEIKGKIESKAQKEMTDAQREYFLRQQLKAIQSELGEAEGEELHELRTRIEAANLPEHVLAAANREVGRLDRIPQASPEHQMIRTYIDWVLDVPWSKTSEDRLDPAAAREVLDADHYDLDKVKERIVEYLAVRKLKGDMKGPILCFVGPPGVGKTSLGQSIARSMQRAFVRISLGGVRDEAEIRGHRRTYIGSMPGRIVQALKQAGTANPVFMLDELDKMSVGFQGDPAAALLEVLDPAQNHAFRDHYLELTYDLSRVLFIATANQLGPVHPALQDRMEVITLSGYTEEEKVHIARRFLIPRQLSAHGLSERAFDLTDAALRRVIAEYTREAGVRNLERELGAVARKVAARVAVAAPGEAAAPTIDRDELPQYLGQPRFKTDVPFRTSRPGVATGVAWTETGGDVLFVEASLLPGGKGQMVLTGQLGNVMQESARAAISHIRANAAGLGVPADFLEKHDLHVHVPAGAIPKDGPSAGVTMATAILSALRHEPVRQDLAMTGEITLSGLVLPVGGIREKALAARRNGIATLVLPADNQPDLEDLPAELKAAMTFKPVTTLEEVVALALPAPVSTGSDVF